MTHHTVADTLIMVAALVRLRDTPGLARGTRAIISRVIRELMLGPSSPAPAEQGETGGAPAPCTSVTVTIGR